MMRALDRLRRSVALLICPELAPLHAGGTVQGAPAVPVGATATEEGEQFGIAFATLRAAMRTDIQSDETDQLRASGRNLPPGWWILPAIILGAAMWIGAALAISDVAGWL
ncbi:hypothetical protein ACTTAF_06605 [Rhodobacter capsulatus]|uniref:hypothetical protein n=1 Tax=Rhodobacter capsulatus TaxID=1061 RepID=UPI0003D3AD5F|nr:hypothetical protein [Rhodobacter capsulatus]ETD85804.1 hypothetical protein U703_02020 [Rhodobacter capsulatus YW1]